MVTGLVGCERLGRPLMAWRCQEAWKLPSNAPHRCINGCGTRAVPGTKNGRVGLVESTEGAAG